MRIVPMSILVAVAGLAPTLALAAGIESKPETLAEMSPERREQCFAALAKYRQAMADLEALRQRIAVEDPAFDFAKQRQEEFEAGPSALDELCAKDEELFRGRGPKALHDFEEWRKLLKTVVDADVAADLFAGANTRSIINTFSFDMIYSCIFDPEWRPAGYELLEGLLKRGNKQLTRIQESPYRYGLIWVDSDRPRDAFSEKERLKDVDAGPIFTAWTRLKAKRARPGIENLGRSLSIPLEIQERETKRMRTELVSQYCMHYVQNHKSHKHESAIEDAKLAVDTAAVGLHKIWPGCWDFLAPEDDSSPSDEGERPRQFQYWWYVLVVNLIAIAAVVIGIRAFKRRTARKTASRKRKST